MVRKIAKISLCFVAGMFAVAIGAGSLTATEKAADLSVHDIMKKVPGKNGLCAKCAAAGKSEKWDEAAKLGAELKEMGDAMVKAKPSKGDAGSWKTHSEGFQKNMHAIAAATEKKDGKALTEAVGAFTKSCKGCHDAHK